MVIGYPVQFVKSVSVMDGNQKISIFTYKNNTESILKDHNISVSTADNVKVNNQNGDLTIKIDRSSLVLLKLNGKINSFVTSKKTVGAFLKERGYKKGELIVINHSLSAPIKDNMLIKCLKKSSSRVKKHKRTPKELRYSSVISYKNGKKASGGKSADTSSWMSDLTPKKSIKLNKKGAPIKYKKCLTGTASAYCCGTTCSTGVAVKQGYIAVDPNIIPYGTKMFIKSKDGAYIYGYAVAADTGGFTSWGNTIADLYMYSYDDCIAFGRREIEIYIL